MDSSDLDSQIYILKDIENALKVTAKSDQTFNDYPDAAVNNAKKALRWRKEHGRDQVKGGTAVGWARANQLANREKLSKSTIRRMAAFNRHRSNSKVDPKFKDTPWKDRGYVAWLIWGGTSGVNWAIRKSESFKNQKALTQKQKMDCPPATEDVKLNTKNRDATIKLHMYGPLNVDEPADYWEKVAEKWDTSVEAAKKSLCANCVAFDISPRMKECIPAETREDDDGELGYCWMHHFKCHSARTCTTWAKGGPIDEDKSSYEWQEKNEDSMGGKETTEKSITKKEHYRFVNMVNDFGGWEWGDDYEIAGYENVPINKVKVNSDFEINDDDVEKQTKRVRPMKIVSYLSTKDKMKPLITDSNYNLLDGYHRLYCLKKKNQQMVRVAIVKPKTEKMIAMKKANPCWDGYEQRGMKKGKDGKPVPNCVPVSKSAEGKEQWWEQLTLEEQREYVKKHPKSKYADKLKSKLRKEKKKQKMPKLYAKQKEKYQAREAKKSYKEYTKDWPKETMQKYSDYRKESFQLFKDYFPRKHSEDGKGTLKEKIDKEIEKYKAGKETWLETNNFMQTVLAGFKPVQQLKNMGYKKDSYYDDYLDEDDEGVEKLIVRMSERGTFDYMKEDKNFMPRFYHIRIGIDKYGDLTVWKKHRKVIRYTQEEVDELGWGDNLDELPIKEAVREELDTTMLTSEYLKASLGSNDDSDRESKSADDPQTPAPPKDRIRGSDKNKRGSASGQRGGIKLSKDVLKSIENKVKEHNEKVKEEGLAEWRKLNVGQAKAVVRRGLGAYSASHRPSVTSRTQWGIARLNAFIHLLLKDKPKNPKYVTDNDLLPKKHPRYSAEKKDLDIFETVVKILDMTEPEDTVYKKTLDAFALQEDDETVMFSKINRAVDFKNFDTKFEENESFGTYDMLDNDMKLMLQELDLIEKQAVSTTRDREARGRAGVIQDAIKYFGTNAELQSFLKGLKNPERSKYYGVKIPKGMERQGGRKKRGAGEKVGEKVRQRVGRDRRRITLSQMNKVFGDNWEKIDPSTIKNRKRRQVLQAAQKFKKQKQREKARVAGVKETKERRVGDKRRFRGKEKLTYNELKQRSEDKERYSPLQREKYRNRLKEFDEDIKGGRKDQKIQKEIADFEEAQKRDSVIEDRALKLLSLDSASFSKLVKKEQEQFEKNHGGFIKSKINKLRYDSQMTSKDMENLLKEAEKSKTFEKSSIVKSYKDIFDGKGVKIKKTDDDETVKRKQKLNNYSKDYKQRTINLGNHATQFLSKLDELNQSNIKDKKYINERKNQIKTNFVNEVKHIENELNKMNPDDHVEFLNYEMKNGKLEVANVNELANKFKEFTEGRRGIRDVVRGRKFNANKFRERMSKEAALNWHTNIEAERDARNVGIRKTINLKGSQENKKLTNLIKGIPKQNKQRNNYINQNKKNIEQSYNEAMKKLLPNTSDHATKQATAKYLLKINSSDKELRNNNGNLSTQDKLKILEKLGKTSSRDVREAVGQAHAYKFRQSRFVSKKFNLQGSIADVKVNETNAKIQKNLTDGKPITKELADELIVNQAERDANNVAVDNMRNADEANDAANQLEEQANNEKDEKVSKLQRVMANRIKSDPIFQNQYDRELTLIQDPELKSRIQFQINKYQEEFVRNPFFDKSKSKIIPKDTSLGKDLIASGLDFLVSDKTYDEVTEEANKRFGNKEGRDNYLNFVSTTTNPYLKQDAINREQIRKDELEKLENKNPQQYYDSRTEDDGQSLMDQLAASRNKEDQAEEETSQEPTQEPTTSFETADGDAFDLEKRRDYENLSSEEKQELQGVLQDFAAGNQQASFNDFNRLFKEKVREIRQKNLEKQEGLVNKLHEMNDIQKYLKDTFTSKSS